MCAGWLEHTESGYIEVGAATIAKFRVVRFQQLVPVSVNMFSATLDSFSLDVSAPSASSLARFFRRMQKVLSRVFSAPFSSCRALLFSARKQEGWC
jgi:hypothetical protein